VTRDDRVVTADATDEGPSVSRLAGQLEYLFEERPELRSAPVAQLVARLNEEDRWARAIARYPNRTDAEVRGHLAEFHDRIGAVAVEQARQDILARTDDPE
jgi:aminopeptidase N